MDWLVNCIKFVNNIVWGWPVIILILGTGLLLTIRTKFLQVRKLGESFGETLIPALKFNNKKKERQGENSISQFAAFSTAISGTVGTGNIIGVCAAIIEGGPGAVFWMWFSAFFGMVTNFSENVLGLYFRKKDNKGNLSGGSFYYIYHGIHWKWLAYVAAVFVLLAAMGMSGVQANKITAALTQSFGTVCGIEAGSNAETLVKVLVGIIIAILLAVIIIGGIKRMGTVASLLIPIMSVLFIILALIVIFKNVTSIPTAFASIFADAFSTRAALGGIMGYAFSQTIKKGMARGVFSNEAGLGSSVIAHSASETREPVKQGLWGIFEVFFDTFIICTLTALMFLTTFDFTNPSVLTGTESDTIMALKMFTENFGTFGNIFFCIIIPLFAFTTIMAWSYYGEKATEFLFKGLKGKGKDIAVLVFKIIYVLFIVVAGLISGTLVWDISDTANGLMAIPNLIALIGLSGLIVKIVKNYYDRKKGIDVEPMLSAYPELNEEFKKDLKNEK